MSKKEEVSSRKSVLVNLSEKEYLLLKEKCRLENMTMTGYIRNFIRNKIELESDIKI